MNFDPAVPSPRFRALHIEEFGLAEEEYQHLLSFHHLVRIPKRSFFVKAGDVNTMQGYVNKGCARSYTLDNKGKEHVLFFGFEDWWLGDIESLETGRPGKQYVQAIEDLELLCISARDFNTLCDTIPTLRINRGLKLRRMFYSMIDRLIEVKSCSPQERLDKLLKMRPDIFGRVAMQDIASYLDIEPPSLSRMRRRMLEAERSTT
jgi:CRP-like cAMP-binding protein